MKMGLAVRTYLPLAVEGWIEQDRMEKLGSLPTLKYAKKSKIRGRTLLRYPYPIKSSDRRNSREKRP